MSERVTVHDANGDHELVERITEHWSVIAGEPVLEYEEIELVLIPLDRRSIERLTRVGP